MTTQEKDRIECAIRHIESSLDVDPWAVEIAVEAMKAQLSAEDTTSDLVSRQAAIDALVKAVRKDPYYDSNEAINGLGVCDVRVILNDLPSAQPKSEERKAESAQNVPQEDLISRKAAIDAFMTSTSDGDKADWCKWVLERLPSAQPEREYTMEEFMFGQDMGNPEDGSL